MKNGLDYFPLDVHLDERFELIEAQFGNTGFIVIIRLWMKIYGGEGYYCSWSEDAALLFSKKIGFPIEEVTAVVDVALKRGLFDRACYKENGILTSREIQTRFFEATVRRKCVEVKGEYLLVERSRLPKNVYIEGENADVFEQSKRKERKEKESKGEEKNEEERSGKESSRDEKRESGAGSAAAYESTDLSRYSPDLKDSIREWFSYKRNRAEAYSALSAEKFLRFEIDRALAKYSAQEICGLIGLCIAKQWKNLHWEELSKSPQENQSSYQGFSGAGEGEIRQKTFDASRYDRFINDFSLPADV